MTIAETLDGRGIDITIRGAGIFGLCTAWTCVQAGARVQIIDPHGAGSGASGGVVGALAPHVPEKWNDKKQFQLESLLMAENFWHGVAQASGRNPGYVRSGRLQPIQNARGLDLANERAAYAHTVWGDHAHWSVIEHTGAAWAPASPTGHLIHDTLSALLHPRHACAALVHALESRGIAIQETGADRGQVLWATGVAGLRDLSDDQTLIGAGEKGQAALLKHDANGAPQLFADFVHVIPHCDATVAIGSTTERYFDDPTTTDDQLEDLIARTRRAFPVLADAPVLERWANLRPRSHNRAPILGGYPNRSGHFIANGGFKIGFGIAPKVAYEMSRLMLTGTAHIPEGFRAILAP